MKSDDELWSVKGADTMLEREPDINPARKWEYEDGLTLDGIYSVYLQTGDRRYLEYVRNNLDLFVDGTGNIANYFHDEFNIDHINNGKVLLNLYHETGDMRYKLAMDRLYDQLKHHPRTAEKTFWHKNIYPYQVWLDGLYMGSVFYARYKMAFDPHDFEDVVHQFLNAYDVTVDRETGLCYHAYDERRLQPWADKETGHSPHFWTRALGWYVMAMVDALEYIPAETPGKDQMLANLVSLLDALQKVADPKTNLWYQVTDLIDRPGNYLESSGSFMIINAIGKGMRMGYLDKEKWGPVFEKAYPHAIEQFITVTNREGWVNVNKMAHVGGLGGPNQRDGSFCYYMSEPIVANDHKGIGPFLLASTEWEQYSKARA